jgi:hypothetical protein
MLARTLFTYSPGKTQRLTTTGRAGDATVLAADEMGKQAEINF